MIPLGNDLGYKYLKDKAKETGDSITDALSINIITTQARELEASR